MLRCRRGSMTVKWLASTLASSAWSSVTDWTHLYTNEPPLDFEEENAGDRRDVGEWRRGRESLRRQLEIGGS
jgi:hypothetical protein